MTEKTPENTGNDEAARFRIRLRDTETQRDQLAASVASLQRQHVETLLAETNVKSVALWKVTDLEALVDDEGTVNPDKVAAAITTARDQFGIAPTPKGNYVPGVGNQPSVPPKLEGIAEAFKNLPKR